MKHKIPPEFNTQQLKVFYMRCVLGKKIKEIAEINETAESTVRVQYRNAISQIKRMQVVLSFIDQNCL
jgi:transcriptional regulator